MPSSYLLYWNINFAGTLTLPTLYHFTLSMNTQRLLNLLTPKLKSIKETGSDAGRDPFFSRRLMVSAYSQNIYRWSAEFFHSR
jgi:hypothetical protein